MLSQIDLQNLVPQLAPLTRPRSCMMVRASHAQYWRDPLAKKKTSWARARFNDANGAKILYLGDDYLTSADETLVALVPTSIVAFAPVECDLSAVLDLTDGHVQGMLQTSPAELAANFRSVPSGGPSTPTQVLGETLAASGQFDGVYYASAARQGHFCLAVFIEALGSDPGKLGGKLSVFDPKQGVVETLP